jgi:hypothetical protein
MAYIMFVNPAILEKAGMDHGAVFVATCLAAALCTAIMGLCLLAASTRLTPPLPQLPARSSPDAVGRATEGRASAR